MRLSILSPFSTKKVYTMVIAFLFIQTAFAQADSVFTAGTPGNNLMKLQQDGGFVVRGYYDGGTFPTPPPEQGPGTRMMWMAQRGAFRAGGVTGTEWNDGLIGYYSLAAGFNTKAPAGSAVALGLNCTASQQASFSVGENNVASGASSVAMGYYAHTNSRQGSFVFADRSIAEEMRASTHHTATWRLMNGFRIFTASDLTTGVTFQSGAAVSNWGQTQAVISTSTGAMLTTGGVWQNSSDVNKKHLFREISGEEILKKLYNVPIQEWSYKNEPDGVRHIGPTAQDFSRAFNLGVNDISIGTVDADGVALACIQALTKRTGEQAKELETLKNAHKELLERMKKLEQQQNSPYKGMNLSILPLAFLPVAGLGMLWYRKRKGK